MSRPARWTILVVVVAVVVLEIVVYLVYRDAIDEVFVNFAIAIYGLFVLVAVWVIDRLIRHLVGEVADNSRERAGLRECS